MLQAPESVCPAPAVTGKDICAGQRQPAPVDVLCTCPGFASQADPNCAPVTWQAALKHCGGSSNSGGSSGGALAVSLGQQLAGAQQQLQQQEQQLAAQQRELAKLRAEVQRLKQQERQHAVQPS